MVIVCPHVEQLEKRHTKPIRPNAPGCTECLASGSEWVHLRLCLTCGHVGCCDSSPNRHATQHFHKTQHPVVKSFEPGEDWGYCYVDDLTVERITTFPEESPARHYSAP